MEPYSLPQHALETLNQNERLVLGLNQAPVAEACRSTQFLIDEPILTMQDKTMMTWQHVGSVGELCLRPYLGFESRLPRVSCWNDYSGEPEGPSWVCIITFTFLGCCYHPPWSGMVPGSVLFSPLVVWALHLQPLHVPAVLFGELRVGLLICAATCRRTGGQVEGYVGIHSMWRYCCCCP